MKTGGLKSLRPYAWLSAAVFLLYFKTLFFGFVQFDDTVLIFIVSKTLKNLSGFWQAFVQSVYPTNVLDDCYYRPILAISFLIDFQLGGFSPFIYHLTNLLIHISGVCLLYTFLRRIKLKEAPAFLFSLLLAAHPALTGAVAWIPGRNDSLLAVFVLASFIFFLDFLKTKKGVHYLWHMIFFALALFTKESAIALPLLGLLYLYLIAGERFFSFNDTILSAGWFAVAFFWFCLRQQALATAPPITIFYGANQVMLKLHYVILYAGKIVFPFNMSVLPTTKDTGFFYGTAAVCLLFAAWFLAKKKNTNRAIFGLCWFVLFMIPSFMAVCSGVSTYLDHRLYLPMIGFIIILSAVDIKSYFAGREKALIILGGAVVLLFSAVTFDFSDNYRDRLSFWRSAVISSPSSELAHNDMGLIYLEKHEYDRAEGEFNRALSINPGFTKAILNLGAAYYGMGRYREARDLWEKVLAMDPNSTDACYDLFVYYSERKDTEKAGEYFNKLERMKNRNFPETPVNVFPVWK